MTALAAFIALIVALARNAAPSATDEPEHCTHRHDGLCDDCFMSVL